MLMKKISLLLVGVLALFSCEQEELDNFVESSGVGQVMTRAIGSSADFDPISELAEIPVNILNIGNSKQKYLTCKEKGTEICLTDKDDGSLRQRWYLKYGRTIVVAGGNNRVTSDTYGVVTPNNYLSSEIPDNLRLSYWNKSTFDSPLAGPGLSFNCLADANCMIYTMYGNFNTGLSSYYLQSESSTSSSVKFKTNNSSSLALWEIVPVGEYELVGLEYVRTTVDSFESTEVICDHDEYTNEHLSVDTWNYSLSTSYTEKSDFSKTEGVSVTISGGLNVGIPNVVGDDSSLGVNVSVQQQTNKSWTYGTSDSKTVTKTRTGQIPIQPGETVKLDAVLVMYKGSLTYVATLRKIGDTKTFRVKGKWSGDCFSSFEARTYNPTTGKLVGEYVLE